MQHSSILKKSSVAFVFTRTYEETPEIKVWKCLDDGIFSLYETQYVIVNLGNNYFKCSFVLPKEDCFLCIKFSNYITFARVGEPKTAILHYSKTNKQIKIKQIDVNNGSIILDSFMKELGEGFYYFKIENEKYSILEIASENKLKSNILKLPYSSGEVIQGEGYIADSNFIDVGLNLIGFLGDSDTAFDSDVHAWVPKGTQARVVDLARAICDYYTLEWKKPGISNPDYEELLAKFIGSWITYIKGFDSTGQGYLTYKPGSTPDSNKANFILTGKDPLNNTIVKGLMIYLAKSLETIEVENNQFDGALIKFRN